MTGMPRRVMGWLVSSHPDGMWTVEIIHESIPNGDGTFRIVATEAIERIAAIPCDGLVRYCREKRIVSVSNESGEWLIYSIGSGEVTRKMIQRTHRSFRTVEPNREANQ